jgi:DNA polymerase-3 subunit alpha
VDVVHVRELFEVRRRSHVHSHYSLLDAVPKIPELVKAAKARKFGALALTDHNNLYGAIEFYEACLKEGIKPIIGCEVSVAGEDITVPVNRDYKSFHLVLLAETNEGYKNLLKIVSFSNTKGFRNKPLVTKVVLAEFHEGLIALLGQNGGL